MNLNNESFVKKALSGSKPVRVQHSDLKVFRPISFEFGDVGSVIVSLGATRVSAVVTATVGDPFPTNPNEGRVMLNVNDTVKHASMSQRTLYENLIQAHLSRIIVQLATVRKEALCIIPGERVWILRVDVKILNNDGNVTDGAALAALAALKHFRLQQTTVDDGIVTVVPAGALEPQPLELPAEMLSASFLAIPADPPVIVADPTREEEAVAQCTPTTVIIDGAQRCCGLTKPGGPPLSVTALAGLVPIAADLTNTMSRELNTAVAEDHRRRLAQAIREGRGRSG